MREEYNARRREKYRSDPEYRAARMAESQQYSRTAYRHDPAFRERAKARANAWHAKKRAERNA